MLRGSFPTLPFYVLQQGHSDTDGPKGLTCVQVMVSWQGVFDGDVEFHLNKKNV